VETYNRAAMPALLPPLLLLLFGAWAGTFTGGAGFAQTVVGHAVLLGVVVWGASRGALGFDALGLGRAGRWLPPALYVAVLASWWASPVPRAGRVGLVLLPAFLVLPAVVASVWDGEVARRRGLRGCSAVVILVALWALWDHLALGSPRAAAPLGHHNLLAVWLLAVLPPAVLPVRERTRWRAAGWLAGALGTAALVATRSLLGAAGLGLLVLAALASIRRSQSWRSARGHRRRPTWVAAAATVAGLVAVLAVGWSPRVVEMAGGRDPSARARTVYWRAGVDGARERPLLGWGPGATPWVLGEHLRPVPGVNPSGEAVGQLHSQPLQLAYELGGTGLALSLALLGLFALRRWRETRAGDADRDAEERDAGLVLAALTGLAASGVALLGTAALDVTAVPMALAVTAGAALAGGASRPSRPAPPSRRAVWLRRLGGLLCVLYVALALAVWIPVDGAHRHYDRSLAMEGAAAARELAAATALDPGFPWYRAWSAWLGGTGPLGRRAAAEPALEAARGAPGVAPLWLMAGVYGLEARSPWAGEALARACRLDPLGPLAPFYLTVRDTESPAAPRHAARALLAEPRLLAAELFDSRPGLLAAALEEVEIWPDVPDGWKVALVETAEDLENLRRTETRRADSQRSTLSVALGGEASTSVALHLFRRRPRELRLAPVTVSRKQAEAVTLPPAGVLPETGVGAFGGRGCEAPRGGPDGV